MLFDYFFEQIVGSQFVRDPPGSTERFTKWANEMTQEQLITQVRELLLFITGQIIRDPPSSTERFTKWANEMTQEQLITQVHV